MNVDSDFNSARTKHMFFKTKVRGYLLGSDSNIDSFQEYLNDLGTWVISLVGKYKIAYDELLEVNYLHNELVDTTRKLIRFRSSGKTEEAKEHFKKIEQVSEYFIQTIYQLENKIQKG